MNARKNVIGIVVAAVAAMSLSAAAADTKGASKYKPPRNEFGHPDLQGTWNNATITPTERPAQYGDRRALTEEEAKKLHEREAEFIDRSSKATDLATKAEDLDNLPNQCRSGSTGAACGYNAFWTDTGFNGVRVQGEWRTSIVTEPLNGRVPPLTAEAAKERSERMASRQRSGAYDGPEARPLGERCLMSFGSSAGPPMLPVMYNNNYQIVQNKDYVMILVEMVHDLRVIRINSKPLPTTMKRWMGDSIGRYEGDSLIVETTNMNPQQSFRGSSAQKVTEKFTRVAPGRIEYEFKVEDPALTAPYAGALTFNATPDSVYEYACHEGNYALQGVLAGARADEATKETK
ncbi:MAG: hypothetical protein H7Y02_05420 [Candidatus Obscuribacterales bacterium]|nr:hypothetical protein [Steroidobacteraceae bacterium]